MAINNPNIRDLLQQRSETIAIEPSEMVTLMERLNLAVAPGSYPEVDLGNIYIKPDKGYF